jgi:hypothetical protein
MQRSTPLIVLGVVVLVGALALGADKTRQLLAARATLGWPAAAGRVVESRLETVRSTSRRRTAATYLVALRYTCAVDGQPTPATASAPPPSSATSAAATRAARGSSCAATRAARR